MNSASLQDFNPINTWEADFAGPRFFTGNPQWLIDRTTGRRYLNEDPFTVRVKCLGLAIVTPLFHTIAAVVNVAYRLFNIIAFAVVAISQYRNENYPLRACAKQAGWDLLHLVTTPLTLIGRQLSAIYGVFCPYDGRKLYASFERAQYGNFICAPCFQPNADRHLAGGDIREQNAW